MCLLVNAVDDVWNAVLQTRRSELTQDGLIDLGNGVETAQVANTIWFFHSEVHSIVAHITHIRKVLDGMEKY